MFGNFLSVKLFADDVKVYVIIDDVAKVDVLQFTTRFRYVNKKTVLSQGNRAMPQLFFSV